MNKNRIRKLKKTLLAISVAAAFSGCSSYLENPMKDKETGENINLLILDFNFFNTRFSVKLLDAKEGTLVTSPATIRFTGQNGNDIVTFAGNKKPEFITSQGQIEVTVDPNVAISENTPLKFAINIEVDGYNSLSRGFQYLNEGKKTIELNLSKVSDENESDLGGGMNVEDGDTSFVFSSNNTQYLKSAQDEENVYQIHYKITLNDLLKFKDAYGNLLFNSKDEVIQAYNANPDNFVNMSISRFANYSPETDVTDIDGFPVTVLFQKLESGKLISLRIDGREVADLNGGFISSWCEYTGTPVPDLFGFGVFITDRWIIPGTEVVYDILDFSYMVVKASTEPLCATGSNILFLSDVISSFSIDTDVYDSENNLLTTYNFKGSFPESFAVENAPQRAVKLVFRDNNPAFQPIAPLEIPDFCTGNYEVAVLPVPGYKEYQVVLKAFCSDDPTIAVAPTYSGEFKITDSDNPWQGIDMVGGVVDLLGLPNREYKLRMLWENDWEYSTLVTEFDENGNYLYPNSSEIHSEKMEDGRIQINIEHNFSQNVCNDLGW